MQYTELQHRAADIVRVKRLWKPAIFTNYEVRLLFDLIPDYHHQKVALGFIALQMMRPSEICDMKWAWLKTRDGQIKEHTHTVYKAKNQKVKSGVSVTYKEVKKPIYSAWLAEQTAGYHKRAPSYEYGKMFQWTTTDALRKWLILARKAARAKKLEPMYDFLLDKCDEVVKGATGTQYRATLYSLRRFAITFHYWVTFKQDIVALANHIGHADPRTTFSHYVKPKEAIGLTQQMIDDEITIDEFIHLQGKKQRQLVEYTPEWKKRMLPTGQSTLHDF